MPKRKKYDLHCGFCGVTRRVSLKRWGGLDKFMIFATFGFWWWLDNVLSMRADNIQNEPLNCPKCGQSVAWVKVKSGLFGWKQVSGPFKISSPFRIGDSL
jgi:ribosomal protein S27AE